MYLDTFETLFVVPGCDNRQKALRSRALALCLHVYQLLAYGVREYSLWKYSAVDAFKSFITTSILEL